MPICAMLIYTMAFLFIALRSSSPAWLFIAFPMPFISVLFLCKAILCLSQASLSISLALLRATMPQLLTYSHVKAPLPEFLHWPMPLSDP